MYKKLIIFLGGLYLFLGSYIFAFESFPYTVGNQSNIPWIYNPISGFYEQKNKETIEMEIISEMDFYSDYSFQKFLDDNHSLSNNYEASDIRKIESDFTSNRSSDFYLRNDVAKSFELMARAFSKAFDFKAKLTINSARRSQGYQRQLAASCSSARCAKPGTSEHEAGLALDLGVNGGNIKSGEGKYYHRLVDNAHKYGFHNSYQKGIEIDGKMIEPWHRRYVGVNLATILHDNNQSFSEYFYQNIEER